MALANSIPEFESFLPQSRPASLPSEPLSAAEELAQRNEIAMQYAADVRSIAGRIHARLPGSMDKEDLVQTGMLALLDLLHERDPRDPMLSHKYVQIRIAGAINDSLRERDPLSRYARNNQRRHRNAAHTVESRTGQRAEDHQIAAELNMDLESYHRFVNGFQELKAVTDRDDEQESEATPVERVHADPTWEPEFRLGRVEMRERLEQSFERLDVIERLILKLHYFDELTLAEIGEKIGRTESRICQLHGRALQKMAADFKRVGLRSYRVASAWTQ